MSFRNWPSFEGNAIDSFPDKYLPVSESSLCKISPGVPEKLFLRPVFQHQDLIHNMITGQYHVASCSTPARIAHIAHLFKVSIRRRLSSDAVRRSVHPAHIIPPSIRNPICVPAGYADSHRRITTTWLSPGLNNPCRHSAKNWSRLLISLMILSVMFFPAMIASSVQKSRGNRGWTFAELVNILSITVTASISSFKRAPWQVSQALKSM